MQDACLDSLPGVSEMYSHPTHTACLLQGADLSA